jgi:HAMP domain-containing protein
MSNFKSIKTQLLAAFLVFTFIGAVISGVSFLYFSKIDRVYAISTSAQNISRLYLKMVKSEYGFFTYETDNSEFFKTGSSGYIDEHTRYLNETRAGISELVQKKGYKEFGIEGEIKAISHELNNYENLFKNIINKTIIKGFKDLGIEGQMRQYVHELERKGGTIGLEEILMLRRHEKDFMLRNDPAYVAKLSAKVEDISVMISKNTSLTSEEKSSMKMLLANYHKSFKQYVKIGQEIGYKDDKGLSESLNLYKNNIEDHFDALTKKSTINEASLLHELQVSFAIVVFNLLVFSVFLSYFFSSAISKPLKKLSKFIEKQIDEKYNGHERLQAKSSTEIGKLQNNVNQMLDLINSRSTVNGKDHQIPRQRVME